MNVPFAGGVSVNPLLRENPISERNRNEISAEAEFQIVGNQKGPFEGLNSRMPEEVKY